MARILIKIVDAVSLDRDKDTMLYKRGDIVKVTEDDYYFGDLIEGNRNPKFAIIDLPGESFLRFKILTEEETEPIIGLVDEFQTIKRRKRRINLTAMTVKELSDLEGIEKRVTMTEARLDTLIEVK